MTEADRQHNLKVLQQLRRNSDAQRRPEPGNGERLARIMKTDGPSRRRPTELRQEFRKYGQGPNGEEV